MIEKLKFVLGRVENVVGKGENAVHQHFILFPQCFRKASYIGSLKVIIVYKRFNSLPHNRDFNDPEKVHSENNVGKGENATFSSFPTMFSTLLKANFNL